MTDAARSVMSKAETIEQQSIALGEELGILAGSTAGVVRISSVPVIINRILVPGLQTLIELHPHLTMELVPEARNIDLTKREADLAIRFSRPTQGGLATKATKLGQLEFGLFIPADARPGRCENLPWIVYDDAIAFIPQARWTENLRKQSNERLCPLKIADIETALEATAAGLGKALLPKIIGNKGDRLRAVDLPTRSKTLSRDVWLLSHTDQDNRPSITAVKSWLRGIDWI